MKNIKFITAKEAVKVIKSNDRIHLHSVAVTPHLLINAMCERGRNKEFRNVRIQHIHTEGPAPYADQEFEGIFQLESFFVGGNVRKQTQAGYADYIPVFLHETQRLIREGYLKVNVAMIQVSVPDKFGYVSLGTSVDSTLAAVENADTVIAIVNPNVPRAFGDAMFHMDDIDLFVEDDSPLFAAEMGAISDTDRKIGRYVAELVDDGATLQMGIGAIPNAVLSMLGNHKDLGVHSEMFADGILPLVEKGVVNG
ncbi:MAG: 4-hydroxybutyrate CoA-transferase, partial [Bacteroidetes bacterium]|nr:4-hydroxybutyrate CoA-transferase [Bacteroidota bacterium]